MRKRGEMSVPQFIPNIGQEPTVPSRAMINEETRELTIPKLLDKYVLLLKRCNVINKSYHMCFGLSRKTVLELAFQYLPSSQIPIPSPIAFCLAAYYVRYAITPIILIDPISSDFQIHLTENLMRTLIERVITDIADTFDRSSGIASPSLGELVNQFPAEEISDIQQLLETHKRMRDARFIIDGRHFIYNGPIESYSQETANAGISYKHREFAKSILFTTNLHGQIVHISNPEPANARDDTIYEDIRELLLLTIHSKTGIPIDQIYILADQGFKSIRTPEVVVHPGQPDLAVKYFNHFRIRIEMMFGRFISSFRSLRPGFKYWDIRLMALVKFASVLMNHRLMEVPIQTTNVSTSFFVALSPGSTLEEVYHRKYEHRKKLLQQTEHDIEVIQQRLLHSRSDQEMVELVQSEYEKLQSMNAKMQLFYDAVSQIVSQLHALE